MRSEFDGAKGSGVYCKWEVKVMRGPKSTYKIQLSSEEAKHLRQLVQAHKTPHAHVVRAKNLLPAHPHTDRSATQIAQARQTSDPMVRKWRKRWLTTHSLADAPRSGAPRRFSRLSSVSRSRRPPVVCRVRPAHLWLAGVALNWLVGLPVACQHLRPQPAR